MWELDYKESWAPKNWCFWTVVLWKTLENFLECKEIKPVNPKGNQSWIFMGRTDAEAETPILWPPDAKNWLIGKDPNAGKGWRQEEKGTTEDEMVGWHHWLDEYEFEQAPGVGDGQGSLVCYIVHGVAKSQTWLSDWTDWLVLQRISVNGTHVRVTRPSSVSNTRFFLGYKEINENNLCVFQLFEFLRTDWYFIHSLILAVILPVSLLHWEKKTRPS